MCGRNFLLIGGGGFLGSNIISKMIENGSGSISVCEPEGIPLYRLTGYPVRIHRCGLKDTETLKKIISTSKIDTVVHLVSTIIPESSFESFKCEIDNIINPTIRLLEYCAEENIQFVYFSSGGTVYGESKRPDALFSEECPMAPISYYGLSKQLIENYIYFMHRAHNLRYIIFRPSNPYGPGQNIYGRQGLIAVAIGKILKGETINVWGDGNTVRDYIYVEDLSFIVSRILWSQSVDNITLNIGSGRGYRVSEILKILSEVTEKPVRINYLPERSSDVSSVVLDISKIKKVIPFTLTDIRSGITNYYRQVKNERK